MHIAIELLKSIDIENNLYGFLDNLHSLEYKIGIWLIDVDNKFGIVLDISKDLAKDKFLELLPIAGPMIAFVQTVVNNLYKMKKAIAVVNEQYEKDELVCIYLKEWNASIKNLVESINVIIEPGIDRMSILETHELLDNRIKDVIEILDRCK